MSVEDIIDLKIELNQNLLSSHILHIKVKVTGQGNNSEAHPTEKGDIG